MFTLTKDSVGNRSLAVLEAVDRQMAKLIASSEEVGGAIVYKIPVIAPNLRYSMFAPFSEVEVSCDTERCSLTLRPGRLLLLPCAFALVAVVVFGLSGPLTAQGVAILIGLPMAVYGVLLVDCLVRTSRWWKRL